MNKHIDETFPMVPITPEHVTYLVAALLVYQQYLQRRRLPSEEREHTLFVLMFLLPKLQQGVAPHQGEMPLLLTVDEVRVIKDGLATMLDQLKRKPVSRHIAQEMTRLQQLKTLFEQHFSTVRD